MLFGRLIMGSGKVVKIGGLREKTVAARRSGSKVIIWPIGQTSVWSELDFEFVLSLKQQRRYQICIQ
jgi:ATP-dependent Lon protease